MTQDYLTGLQIAEKAACNKNAIPLVILSSLFYNILSTRVPSSPAPSLLLSTFSKYILNKAI